DELGVILNTGDPAVVTSVIERIHAAIAVDKPLQTMFKAPRVHQAKRIRESIAQNTARGGYGQVPWDGVEALKDAARIRPSVSIGSAKIHGSWDGAWARANQQGDLVKGQYKFDIGSPTAKTYY